LKEFIDHQLATKGYGNVSEYLRSLLREAQKEEAEARLEALLLEGLASGDDIALTPEFWKDLKSGSARHRREAQGAEAAVKAVIRRRGG
jgi:antitoxin ParD1/3/4